MKTRGVLIAGVLAVAMSFMTVAVAEEHGTKDEAKALVDAAVAHVQKVGPEQAFKDFTTDKANWTKKDLYVFAMDMKGICHAHGANDKLVGREQMAQVDPNGVLFISEMTKVAQASGQGWVDYTWVHPQTKKQLPKSTYVHKLANYDGWVGVGVYR